MMDIVIQGCGSLEAAMVFCADNGVELSDVPVVGDVYVVSDAAIAAAGAAGVAVLRYLAQHGTATDALLVGTLGTEPGFDYVLTTEDGDVLTTEDGGATIVMD